MTWLVSYMTDDDWMLNSETPLGIMRRTHHALAPTAAEAVEWIRKTSVRIFNDNVEPDEQIDRVDINLDVQGLSSTGVVSLVGEVIGYYTLQVPGSAS